MPIPVITRIPRYLVIHQMVFPLWSRDSGTGTIAVPTQKTTTVNGDGVFRLTVTAANGCTSSATTEVALDRTPPNITNLINNDAVQEITCSNTEVN